MGQRTVRGVIRRPDRVWDNAQITFALFSPSFTPSTQYPSTSVVVYADGLGEFTANLWTNEEGAIASVYSCKIEDDDPFEFTIPVGTGDLELSVLRESGSVAPGTPQWTSILTLVEERIQDAIDSFPSGGGGGGGADVSYQATFTQSNLSIIGLIPVTYPVAIPASGLVVYDNDGNTVNPDYWRSISSTAIEINLESFIPIVGTWIASISL